MKPNKSIKGCIVHLVFTAKTDLHRVERGRNSMILMPTSDLTIILSQIYNLNSFEGFRDLACFKKEPVKAFLTVIGKTSTNSRDIITF